MQIFSDIMFSHGPGTNCPRKHRSPVDRCGRESRRWHQMSRGWDAQVLLPRRGLTLFCRQLQGPGFQNPQRLHSAPISVNRSKLSLQSLRPRSAVADLGRDSCQPVTDCLCFHRPNRSAEYFDPTGCSCAVREEGSWDNRQKMAALFVG